MPVDRAVVTTARRQHGIVTAAQLGAAGLSAHAIAHRVAKGWLSRRHHGVYLVGPLETPLSAAMAAVLAYGDGALLSHYPAAVLWGWRPGPMGPMHVIAAGKSRPGITVHRARLDLRDATCRHGIPVTSPARTLLDVAADRDVDGIADEARISRLVTDRSLNEQLSRYPRHPGKRRLAQALRADPKLTRSEAERRLLEMIRKAGLPEPQTNIRIGRHEVDFVWLRQRLVVEVDGYAFHSGRRSFERDRRRDAELIAAGYRVIRLTWRQITDQPEATIAILAVALAAQPAPSVALTRSSTVSA